MAREIHLSFSARTALAIARAAFTGSPGGWIGIAEGEIRDLLWPRLLVEVSLKHPKQSAVDIEKKPRAVT